MATDQIYNSFKNRKAERRKQFAVLIDPDKIHSKNIGRLINLADNAGVDYFLIGGSLMVNNTIDDCIQTIKANCKIPTLLFPGNSVQLSFEADGILFLSLISGRNPDLLIGQHVIAAPLLKKSAMEILSTGYMLIDGGAPTSVTYMSNTSPIPADKPDIAVCTALAGEMLGLKLIYLDAGSGALNPVPKRMVHQVSKNINIPLIVGGGIRTPEQAVETVAAGADVIVVGNAIEKDTTLLSEIASVIHAYGTSGMVNTVR